MSYSFTKIWIHAMWTTKKQTNIIHPSFQPKLYTALERQFLELGCTPKLITGNSNHVHCLYLQNPTKSIAEVINPKLSLENKRGRAFDVIGIHPNSGEPFPSFHCYG